LKWTAIGETFDANANANANADADADADAVSVVVQNADEEGVEKARIELSAASSGHTFKKITDDEGIARFSQLPAERLHVKVTAPGYRSYSGDFTLENGADPFVIKLRKRD